VRLSRIGLLSKVGRDRGFALNLGDKAQNVVRDIPFFVLETYGLAAWSRRGRNRHGSSAQNDFQLSAIGLADDDRIATLSGPDDHPGQSKRAADNGTVGR